MDNLNTFFHVAEIDIVLTQVKFGISKKNYRFIRFKLAMNEFPAYCYSMSSCLWAFAP